MNVSENMVSRFADVSLKLTRVTILRLQTLESLVTLSFFP